MGHLIFGGRKVRRLDQSERGNIMTLKIATICACAGVFALAHGNLAHAASFSAFEFGSIVESANPADLEGGIVFTAANPRTGGPVAVKYLKYPCQDYDPKAHKCGGRAYQEPPFMRRSKQTTK